MTSITNKATEIAESLRDKVSDVLPLNNPKMNKIFACVAPESNEAEFDSDDSMFSEYNENDRENMNSKKNNDSNNFSAISAQMRDIVNTTFNKKFKCNGEDDADTKLTENENGSSYYDDCTSASRTVGLNTVDERNNIHQHSKILGVNNRSMNRTYRTSFKDKYVQMKAKQQFAPTKPTEDRKSFLSIDAGQAVIDYDNAKMEKERRQKLAQQKAQQILENAALRTGDPRSPSMALRQPIDP